MLVGSFSPKEVVPLGIAQLDNVQTVQINLVGQVQFICVYQVGGDEAWILFGSHNLFDAVAVTA